MLREKFGAFLKAEVTRMGRMFSPTGPQHLDRVHTNLVPFLQVTRGEKANRHVLRRSGVWRGWALSAQVEQSILKECSFSRLLLLQIFMGMPEWLHLFCMECSPKLLKTFRVGAWLHPPPSVDPRVAYHVSSPYWVGALEHLYLFGCQWSLFFPVWGLNGGTAAAAVSESSSRLPHCSPRLKLIGLVSSSESSSQCTFTHTPWKSLPLVLHFIFYFQPLSHSLTAFSHSPPFVVITPPFHCLVITLVFTLHAKALCFVFPDY